MRKDTRVVITTMFVLALATGITSILHGQGKGTIASLGNDPTTFDQKINTAMITKDVAFLTTTVADDVRYTHSGGLVWNKQQLLEATRSNPSLANNIDSVEVEPHGNLIETVGHLQVKRPDPNNPEFHVYYVRLYARRAGSWQFISHRTVRMVKGPLPPK